MSEMRLMEKYRLCKLTDFAYTWDTTYNYICNRASDDFSTDTRSTATTTVDATYYDDYPTWHVTSKTFIVQEQYKFTTVFDGRIRANFKYILYASLTYTEDISSTYQVYMRVRFHLKAITSAGVTRTLATSPYSSTLSVSLVYNNTSGSVTAGLPFSFDIDNAILENDERLIIVIDTEIADNGTGLNVQNHAGHTATLYHTINTDESFVKIPIVP